MEYITTHSGIVTAVDSDRRLVDVRVVENLTKCSGCALFNVCSPGGTSDSASVIAVADSCQPALPAVGSRVEVGLPQRSQWFSSVVVMIMPIVVFLIALGLSLTFGCDDVWCAAIALGAVALYLLALIPFRDAIYRHTHWHLIATLD